MGRRTGAFESDQMWSLSSINSIYTWMSNCITVAINSLVFSAALMLIFLCPGRANAQVSSGEPGYYFLVVDHSGSMLTPIARGPEKGRTRWDLMRDRASGFVDRLPDGSHVWAIIFSAEDPVNPNRPWFRTLSAQFNSKAERDNFTQVLQTYPEPGVANGTWLRQAIDMALDQAEAVGANKPDAFLTVMVYTDGVDEGHGRTRGDISRNKGSSITEAHLDARLSQLRRQYRNFNVVNVYRQGDESIRDAHVVRLLTNRLQLVSPLIRPRQQLSLEFAFRDTQLLALSGRPISLSIEGEAGGVVPLKVTGGPFKLTSGKTVITIERGGDWPPGRDVRAMLRIGYPNIEGSYLVAEGGAAVDLLIQGAEAPSIRDLRPEPGAAFPTERDLLFSLTTLPDATVEWNLGDGRTLRGNPVSASFSDPGRRKVTVTVIDPKTKLSTSESLEIEVARFDIKLDAVAVPLIPNNMITLTATSEGNFDRFTWNVDGQLYPPSDRKDGKAGTALEIRFERPGPVRVSVAGEAKNGGRVESPPLILNVRPVPALRVTSPASGDVLYFGSSREFRVEVEGVQAHRIRFTLVGADGRPILPPKEVDVAQQGPLRVAVLSDKMPMLRGRVEATLRAESLGIEPALVREVPVVLEREATSIEVFLPDGPEPFIHRYTAVRLHASAPIVDLRWDFGDETGPVPGHDVERHIWTHYGDYRVRAVARDADGKQIESPPLAIKVPVRPVSAQPELIYEGKRVGIDTDRVPIKATLKLRATFAGDAQRIRWFLNGAERPAGEETMIVEQRGSHRLRLLVEGTPEAGSVESTIEFHAGDPLTFWLASIGLAGLLILSGWVLLGNRWRFAEFQAKTDGATWNERDTSGDIKPDAEIRRLGAGKSEAICGRWNLLTKKASVRIASLDNRLQTALETTSYVSSGFIRWKDEDTFVFTGTDKPPVLRGALNGMSAVRPVARRDKLNQGTPRPKDWRVCWLMDRPGMPSQRPPSVSPGPSFETLAIFVRIRRKGGGFIYWLELAFCMLSMLAVVAIAQCYWTLY